MSEFIGSVCYCRLGEPLLHRLVLIVIATVTPALSGTKLPVTKVKSVNEYAVLVGIDDTVSSPR